MKDCWLSSECHLSTCCASWEPPQMLQVLASLSGRTHIQYPSDKSTPVWCEKNKKTKTTTSCCWVLNGVSSLWLHLTLSLCGRRRAIQNNPEIRIISEVQKPLVYQDTTMTKDDDLLPLRMAPPWDMRLPGRHPPNTPCAHPSRGSNHTSELIQRSCMELRIGDTRVSRPIITGFVDSMVILWWIYIYI